MEKHRCPDQICHDKVVRVTFFMKIFGATVGILITILLIIGMNIGAAENKQDEKIAQIPVIQKDIEHIKADIKKIAEKVDQQIDKKDLDRLIDAVKKGK